MPLPALQPRHRLTPVPVAGIPTLPPTHRARQALRWGRRRRALQLPPRPGSVTLARRWAGRVCDRWQTSSSARAAALQCVSELVSNAIQHGEPARGQMVLTAARSGGVLTLAVTQPGPPPGPIQAHQAGPDDEHGRGLALVDAYADTWGVSALASGTCVWCRISWPVQWIATASSGLAGGTWTGMSLTAAATPQDVAGIVRRDLDDDLSQRGHGADVRDRLLVRIRVWQTADGRRLQDRPDYDSARPEATR